MIVPFQGENLFFGVAFLSFQGVFFAVFGEGTKKRTFWYQLFGIVMSCIVVDLTTITIIIIRQT